MDDYLFFFLFRGNSHQFIVVLSFIDEEKIGQLLFFCCTRFLWIKMQISQSSIHIDDKNLSNRLLIPIISWSLSALIFLRFIVLSMQQYIVRK